MNRTYSKENRSEVKKISIETMDRQAQRRTFIKEKHE